MVKINPIHRRKSIKHLVSTIINSHTTLIQGISPHRRHLFFFRLVLTCRIIYAITRKPLSRLVYSHHRGIRLFISPRHNCRVSRGNQRRIQRAFISFIKLFFFLPYLGKINIIERTKNILVLQMVQVVKSNMIFSVGRRNIKHTIVEWFYTSYHIVLIRSSSGKNSLFQQLPIASIINSNTISHTSPHYIMSG